VHPPSLSPWCELVASYRHSYVSKQFIRRLYWNQPNKWRHLANTPFSRWWIVLIYAPKSEGSRSGIKCNALPTTTLGRFFARLETCHFMGRWRSIVPVTKLCTCVAFHTAAFSVPYRPFSDWRWSSFYPDLLRWCRGWHLSSVVLRSITFTYSYSSTAHTYLIISKYFQTLF
jgi:hypothetical protein